jgi:hypothetical protein
MIRFVVRLAGLLLIAAALAAIVVDTAQSIAASTVTLTEIGSTWSALSPETLVRVQEFVQVRLVPILGEWVWNPVTTSLLTMPVSLQLAVLGFLLLFAGAPRRKVRHA